LRAPLRREGWEENTEATSENDTVHFHFCSDLGTIKDRETFSLVN
jgi:hypothetical protein